MAYLLEWEQLGDALKRVVGAGSPEQLAQRDICLAIADQKIKIRPTVEFTTRSSNDHQLNQRFALEYRNYVRRLFTRSLSLELPWRLKPADFHWSESRFETLWQFEPGMEGFPGPPRLGLVQIELFTTDVIGVLCDRANGAEQERTGSKTGSGAKTRGIVEAIGQLWPTGIPQGLSAKERNNAIIEQMKHNKSSIPNDPARAIQRALKAQLLK